LVSALRVAAPQWQVSRMPEPAICPRKILFRTCLTMGMDQLIALIAKKLCNTSTRAQYLRSNFVVMWTASAWNCEFSPTKISVLHWSFFSASVKSCLLIDRVAELS
jgi:hypothetical protein